MIKKNKDGSYNKFQLSIIILIAIVSIFMIGALVIQNVELPQWNQPEPIIVINNTTIETVPLINDSGKLSWIETETYVREGGGGGKGSYVTNYNTTYAIGGGGGHGEGNPISNSNDTYIYCNKDECNTTITSWEAPTNATITYLVVGGGGGSHYINSTQGMSTNTIVITTQPTILQSDNTSQNVTVADAIVKVIDVFPNTIWILLIFIFLITAAASGNGVSGFIFPLSLIIILWWLNIFPFNWIIFIISAIFIYYILRMFSSDR